MLRFFAQNLSLIFIGLFLTACGQVTAVSATFTPESQTSTPTFAPTPTLIPSPSATPTQTPFPELSKKGPYLMIDEYSDRKFVIYSGIGSGRKMITLPSNGYLGGVNSSLKINVSPDGQWLAFYTGNFSSSTTPENLPITLKLININNGVVKEIVSVVTNGYQDKLNQVAEKLKKLDPDKYMPRDEYDWVFGNVTSPFEGSIESVAWAPDSKTLAFAAQIDGISSDVYLYTLETGEIKRVEDSLQSVYSISWSPDGKYIVFENFIPSYTNISTSLHVVKPGKDTIKEPKVLYANGAWLGGGGGWLSPTIRLIADGSDTIGNFNLQALDIVTGQLKPLWKGVVSDYAIDTENQIIALNSSEYARPENQGLYFITFDGKKRKIWDGVYWLEIFFRGGGKNRFLIESISVDKAKEQYTMNGEFIGLDLDGKPTPIGKIDYDKISISRDLNWLLMYDKEKLYIYDINDTLVKTFPITGIRNAIWRPDSQAIFYSTDTGLYIISLPDGETKQIDVESRDLIRYAVWLP